MVEAREAPVRSILISVLLAAAMLMPAVTPLAGATTGECLGPDDPRCAPLTLYFQAQGRPMSSLPGDALPGEPWTEEKQPSTFTAETQMLSEDLVLAKADAFTVYLHDRRALVDGSYNTSVRVAMVDASGNTRVLAEEVFRAHRANIPSIGGGNVSDDPRINGTEQSARSAYTYVRDTAVNRIKPNGSPSSGLFTPVCPQGESTPSTLCGTLYGDYGRGTSLRACAEWRGGPLNPLVPLVRSTGACDRYTAANLTQATFHEGLSLLDSAIEAAENESGLPPTPPTPLPRVGRASDGDDNWTRMTINAAPPANLAQDASTFVVPAGWKLSLQIKVEAKSSIGAPLVSMTFAKWSLGRADAPSGLTLRVAQPTPFSAFAAGAEVIGAGEHSGFLARPAEADDYLFYVAAGEAVVLQGNARLQVYSPSGIPLATTFRATESGYHVLRVMSSTSTVGEYRFNVAYQREFSTASDGTRIEDGNVSGHLGAYDTADRYVFDIDTGQKYRLQLFHGPGVKFTLDRSGATYGESPREQVDSAFVGPWAWEIPVEVRRISGDGPYTLTLWRDPDGRHDDAPLMVPAWSSPLLRRAGSLGPAPGDGIRVLTEAGLYRVTTQGGELERSEIQGTGSTTYDSDGRILYADHRRVHVTDATDTSAVARTLSGEFEVGPDGSVYSYNYNRTVSNSTYSREQLMVTSPDYREQFLPVTPMWRLAFAPDGQLYGIKKAEYAGDTVYRINRTDGALTSVYKDVWRLNGLAFDEAGRGYVSTDDGRIVRFGTASTGSKVVAVSDSRLDDLAFSGTGLYAISIKGNGPFTVSIVSADLDTAGFEGFRNPRPYLPPADLVVANVTEERLPAKVIDGMDPIADPEARQDRVLHVTVKNQGTTPVMTDFMLAVAQTCPSGQVCSYQFSYFNYTRITGGLGAGESRVISLPWSTQGHVGTITFRAIVDEYTTLRDEVIESDESNNSAVHQSTVVHGHTYSPT